MLQRAAPALDRPPAAKGALDPGLPGGLAGLHHRLGNAEVRNRLLGRGEPLASFPHQPAIQRSLGAIPGLAVVDQAACAARGVSAFTEGDTTFFRDPCPRLEVAAHEAAHQLQHAGRSRDAGLGAEGHAEAVAQQVSRAEDARPLLDGRGDAVTGAVHDYTVIPVEQQGADSAFSWTSPAGQGLKVSDDGQLAVGDPEQDRTQAAWATDAHIQASNAVLEAQGATVRLKAGAAELHGAAPYDGGAAHTLSRVVVTNEEGAPATLTGDCSDAAAEVMGAEGRVSAVVARGWAGDEILTDPHPTQSRQRGAALNTPELWFIEILRMAYGSDLSTDQLFATYNAQTPDERDAFEKRYGVNRQAVPEVGEALTIGSMPVNPAWGLVPGVTDEQTYNWHFATCVLKSGDDVVTLENYARRARGDWYFSMFGPARYGQSFHEGEASTNIFGTEPVSMVVTQSDALRLRVRLTEGADLGGDSEIYVRLRTAIGATQTAAVPMAAGESESFVVSLAGLLPWGESQPLTVEVVELDLLWDDPLFQTIWTPPFTTGRDAGNGVEISGERVK